MLPAFPWPVHPHSGHHCPKPAQHGPSFPGAQEKPHLLSSCSPKGGPPANFRALRGPCGQDSGRPPWTALGTAVTSLWGQILPLLLFHRTASLQHNCLHPPISQGGLLQFAPAISQNPWLPLHMPGPPHSPGSPLCPRRHTYPQPFHSGTWLSLPPWGPSFLLVSNSLCGSPTGVFHSTACRLHVPCILHGRLTQWESSS